jgi:hypothetical protein
LAIASTHTPPWMASRAYTSYRRTWARTIVALHRFVASWRTQKP